MNVTNFTHINRKKCIRKFQTSVCKDIKSEDYLNVWKPDDWLLERKKADHGNQIKIVHLNVVTFIHFFITYHIY